MTKKTAAPEDPIEQRNRQLRALLAACVLRDRTAFTRLYDLTSAKLYGVLLRILNSEEWAQECLQEVYIKIWNKAEAYRPELAAPLTWMTRIARNQALDQLRQRRHEAVRADPAPWAEEVDQEPLPQERLQLSQEGQRLNRCLEQLQSRQRQVIALAYFKGMSHDELATLTGTPIGTIKTWIRRGLEQLKRCLTA